MNKSLSVGAVLIYFGLSLPANAASDTLQQLKDCARTENTELRVACYEALGKAVLAAESQANANGNSTADATTKSTTAESVAMPDSIGGGKFSRDANIPEEQFKGMLKSCKKSLDKRWFYFFENGQIWKQVQHKSIRHKNCNVAATLSKDGFGYKMRIEGEDRKVRVRRHR